jgi:hypothetical protein
MSDFTQGNWLYRREAANLSKQNRLSVFENATRLMEANVRQQLSTSDSSALNFRVQLLETKQQELQESLTQCQDDLGLAQKELARYNAKHRPWDNQLHASMSFQEQSPWISMAKSAGRQSFLDHCVMNELGKNKSDQLDKPIMVFDGDRLVGTFASFNQVYETIGWNETFVMGNVITDGPYAHIPY